MRKISRVLVPCLLCVAAPAVAEIKMVAKANGKIVGSATFAVVLDKDGKLTAKLRLQLNLGGRKSMISLDDSAARDGRPVRQHQVVETMGQTQISDRVFGATSVQITKKSDGESTTGTRQIGKREIRDPSAFWFIKARPKVGATVKFWSLSEDDQWELVTSRYLGIKTIVVAGRTVKSNYIEHKQTKEYLDNSGMPYRIDFDLAGMVLTVERTKG